MNKNIMTDLQKLAYIKGVTDALVTIISNREKEDADIPTSLVTIKQTLEKIVEII